MSDEALKGSADQSDAKQELCVHVDPATKMRCDKSRLTGTLYCEAHKMTGSASGGGSGGGFGFRANVVYGPMK